MGCHVIVEYLLLWECRVVDPIVCSWEVELFPMHDFTLPHHSVNFVVRPKTMVADVLGLCDLAIMRDGHTVSMMCTRVIEDPITSRVVNGSEVSLN